MRRALLLPLCVLGFVIVTLAGCGSSAPPGSIAFSGVVNGDAGVYEVDAGGGHLRRVAGFGSQLAWSPEGSRLAFLRDGSVWTITRPGAAIRLAVRGPVYEYSWSPDGKQIVYRGDDFGLYVATPEAAVRRLTADGRAPVWSPDGRLIAFLTSVAHVNDQGETEYVAVVRPDGRGRTRLQIALTARVAWSPDSMRLAFAAPVGGLGYHSGNLYSMLRDGTDVEAVLPNERFNPQGGDWSPDGSRLAFSDGTGTWVVDANGENPHRVSAFSFAAWSPDGKWVAVQAPRVLDVVPAHGGKPRSVIEARSIDSVAWRPSMQR